MFDRVLEAPLNLSNHFFFTKDGDKKFVFFEVILDLVNSPKTHDIN